MTISHPHFLRMVLRRLAGRVKPEISASVFVDWKSIEGCPNFHDIDALYAAPASELLAAGFNGKVDFQVASQYHALVDPESGNVLFMNVGSEDKPSQIALNPKTE